MLVPSQATGETHKAGKNVRKITLHEKIYILREE